MLRRPAHELEVPWGDDLHVYMHTKTFERRFHPRSAWNINAIQRYVCVIFGILIWRLMKHSIKRYIWGETLCDICAKMIVLCALVMFVNIICVWICEKIFNSAHVMLVWHDYLHGESKWKRLRIVVKVLPYQRQGCKVEYGKIICHEI